MRAKIRSVKSPKLQDQQTTAGRLRSFNKTVDLSYYTLHLIQWLLRRTNIVRGPGFVRLIDKVKIFLFASHIHTGGHSYQHGPSFG